MVWGGGIYKCHGWADLGCPPSPRTLPPQRSTKRFTSESLYSSHLAAFYLLFMGESLFFGSYFWFECDILKGLCAVWEGLEEWQSKCFQGERSVKSWEEAAGCTRFDPELCVIWRLSAAASGQKQPSAFREAEICFLRPGCNTSNLVLYPFTLFIKLVHCVVVHSC